MDSVFQAIADRIRREIIRTLESMEADEIRYEALLEELEVNMETSELRVQLSHVHLPHLESAGLVEFDNRSETVRYHPRSLVRETVDMVEIVDS